MKTEFSQVDDLFIPYPKGYKDTTDKLNLFFKELVGLIPNSIRQFVIVNNQDAGIEIETFYPQKNIKIILIEGFNELWLRDIMGFNGGSNFIFKPIYKPDYCNYIYTEAYLEQINNQVRQIFRKSINPEIIDIPLIIDGGNFVSNGTIAFMTDKVLKDNLSNSDNIKKTLFQYLGVNAIIIESNKNDKLSHSDGYLNFLDKDKVCLSKYPQIDFLKDDIIYLDSLTNILKDNSLNIVSIYDRPIDEKVIGGGKTLIDKSKDCLNSARGIFVNFLILNKTIIMPEYSTPNYKRIGDYNAINRRILTDLGYNVISINCDDLAKQGGSLHCISFTN